MGGNIWVTSRMFCIWSKHFYVISLCGKSIQNQRPTACLLMWPPQASGRHCFNIRNQLFPPLFVPVLHDVMATRQRGDELRVMDICIGTFPFPRQPLFTLKALHIIHQYRPPGQVLHRCAPPNPHVEALSSPTFAALFTALQPIRFREIR